LRAYEDVYKKTSLVVISPSNTNPRVTDDTDSVWRLVGRDDVQGRVASQFARGLNKKHAYAVSDSASTYSKTLAKVFHDDFQANGLKVEDTKFYSGTLYGKQDIFTPIINDILSLKDAPDIIYFTGAADHAGDFFKMARDKGIAATFLGSDSLDREALLQRGGQAVAGTYFTTVAAPAKEFPQAQKFVDDYSVKHGYPTSFTLEGYDSATLCIKAIAMAAREYNPSKPDREQVLDAMRKIQNFSGISGNYHFNSNGDPDPANYYIIEVSGDIWSNNKVVDKISAHPPQ